MSEAIARFFRNPVIPVVVIDDAAQAAPLAEALLAGGISAIEITLRTSQALAAMESIARHVPAMQLRPSSRAPSSNSPLIPGDTTSTAPASFIRSR